MEGRIGQSLEKQSENPEGRDGQAADHDSQIMNAACDVLRLYPEGLREAALIVRFTATQLPD